MSYRFTKVVLYSFIKLIRMKKSNHKVSQTIDVSPSAAWQIIGAVEGVDKWLMPIQACRVEGGKRYCTTEKGEFAEDILKIDHENYIFKYRIPSQNMMPIENILGQMSVNSAGGKAVVEWAWEFDVEEATEATAKEMLTMIGNMGIEGIESLIKKEAGLAA